LSRFVSLAAARSVAVCVALSPFVLWHPLAAFAQVQHTPAKVLDGSAKLVQHYDPTQKLRLAFLLTPPHLAEEKELIEQLHDKKSPLFHQFLTAEQFNARFAPSAADEQAVVAWAQSVGMTVTNRFANRMVVDAEASAGVIEDALKVTISQYSLGGATYFSNDRDPLLPGKLASIVQHVEGLNSFERFLPASKRGVHTPLPDYTPGPARAEGVAAAGDATASVKAAKSRPQAGMTPDFTNNAFDPQDLYSSQGYNYGALNNQGHCCNPYGNPNNSPPVSSIALATFGDVNYNDVAGFQSTFPYLAWLVQHVYIDGGYSCGAGFNDNCLEATLDTEWSLAMANSFGSSSATAKVYIYESSGSAADMYNFMLSDGYARVFSTSWGCSDGVGCSDGYMNSIDSIFSAMVVQGWSLVAASGDQGATATCGDLLDVQFPASDPNVVAVGGTSLVFYTDNTFDYEVAWTGGTGAGSCGKNNGGGTGGFSSYFGAPSYQSNFGWTRRAVPDISLNSGGINQAVYYNGGLSNWEGTSIAAPEMAGFFAQENAYLLAMGNVCFAGACAPLGNPNYVLYGGNLQSGPHYPFYDILYGCNSNDITLEFGLSSYCAGPGYDLATGWGSANMLQLAWGINWGIASSTAGPSVNYTGPATGVWYNSDQIVGWTVIDNASGGAAPTGLAGFTQGWDSIPADPTREATQGSGNSFYSGPEYPNGSGGCLSFAGDGGCAGGSGQGCHIAHVRAWNNMGVSSGDTTYGPVCYDTIAPIVTASLSPAANAAGWNNTAVNLTLNAGDPGLFTASGVVGTYYGSLCGSRFGFCFTYNGPIPISASTSIRYDAVDRAGNVSSLNTISIQIDALPPVTSVALSGTQSGVYYITPVQITLTATDNASGVAATTYTLDGGANTTYSAPFTVSAPGSHTLTYFSSDVAGNLEAAHTVSFLIGTAPSVVSILPDSGTAASQIFTANYADADGGAAISSVFLLFNTSVSSANACYVQYYPSSNLLYLKNDAGTGVSSGVAPGSSATVSNSQCTLSGTGSSYSYSGNTATLHVALTFSGTAPTNIYLYAVDKDGLTSGWQQEGVWGLVAPTAVSVTPNVGSGFTQTFSAVYSDANGAAGMNSFYMMFNTSVTATGACWVEYNPFSKLLFLQGNATGVMPGSPASVSNARCTLTGTGSSFSTSGNTATLVAALTFSSNAFANIYLYASDKDGKNSGWVQKGSWGVPLAPSVVSVTPSTGSGAVQQFSAVFSDPNGAGDVNAAYILLNSSVSTSNGCYVGYNPTTNLLSLKNDAGTGSAGSVTPGSTATISNSQCTLAGTGSSYSTSGNTATLEVALTLSGSTATNVYLYASDRNGTNSGWVKKGTWTP